MAKCPQCGELDLDRHTNDPNILINKHTGEAHRCDPGERLVPSGKWRGYKFKDMAKMWAHKKEADNNI